MPHYTPDNYWMICLNCEHDFSMEEYMIESNFQCVFCDSQEFRVSDSVGGDLDLSQFEGQLDRLGL